MVAEHIPTLEEMLRSYNQQLNQAHQERLEELRRAFSGLGGQGIGSQKLGGNPKWTNLREMNAALAAQRKAQQPKPIDKDARIKEIEHELDIIRGRVPTPKGYTISPAKVKALTKELKELLS